MAPKLPVHEWLVVMIGIGVILVLTLVTQINRTPELPPLTKEEKVVIEIIIKGAVRKPTVVKVEKGTRFEEIADRVPLLPEANMERVRRKILKNEGQIIHIPKKRKKS